MYNRSHDPSKFSNKRWGARCMYYLNLQKVLGWSINLIKALRACIRQTAHRLRDRPWEARHGRLGTSQPRGQQGGFWRDASVWRHRAAVAAVIAIARAGTRRRGALLLVGGRFDGVEGGLSFACLVGQVGPLLEAGSKECTALGTSCSCGWMQRRCV